ncbi:hypothetical protein H5410_022353 [Solanum commersonii]|uniref:Uncharacterized protein n=1 Tax=Solanum commersonii TaxID=4109 RepID=A0A9J5ZGX5_SOLCO|nr:hypothetical protein H5410_022353 [Solanum commersonii]
MEDKPWWEKTSSGKYIVKKLGVVEKERRGIEFFKNIWIHFWIYGILPLTFVIVVRFKLRSLWITCFLTMKLNDVFETLLLLLMGSYSTLKVIWDINSTLRNLKKWKFAYTYISKNFHHLVALFEVHRPIFESTIVR